MFALRSYSGGGRYAKVQLKDICAVRCGCATAFRRFVFRCAAIYIFIPREAKQTHIFIDTTHLSQCLAFIRLIKLHDMRCVYILV